MANKHLLKRLEGIQKMLMGVHAAGVGMSSATKGAEREAFVHSFLEHALPPVYRFGTGDATDASGRRSGQLDVVIEYPFAPNLPLGTGSPTRLYLAEAVAAVVEVKSDLAGQWAEAKKTADALAPLRRAFGATVSMGPPPSDTIPTYVVGYSGWKTIETIMSKLTDATNIAGVLVIEGGLFVGRRYEARGPAALWAFICDLFGNISALQSASVSPVSYLNPTPSIYNVTTSGVASDFASIGPMTTASGSLWQPKPPK